MKFDNSENKLHYGKKLKQIRESYGLTQERVAEYLGLGPRYISDIERNKTKGSIDTLIKLCNIYNITPNDLLNEYIYFDIEKSNLDLSGFYSLNSTHKQMILDLIKFLNQQENKS